MTVLPFYGTRHPDLFAIERRAMDRSGAVLRALDTLLPGGRVLDIGAGNGFTARALRSARRSVVALEPSRAMLGARSGLDWLRGDAAALPLRSDSFAAAYATWAWFFPSVHPIEAGVREALRVIEPGGPLALVNNLGGDEFCALAERDISEPVAAFEALGFRVQVVETAFEFDDIEEARRLLSFYFGEAGRAGARKRLAYRVGIFTKRA